MVAVEKSQARVTSWTSRIVEAGVLQWTPLHSHDGSGDTLDATQAVTQQQLGPHGVQGVHMVSITCTRPQNSDIRPVDPHTITLPVPTVAGRHLFLVVFGEAGVPVTVRMPTFDGALMTMQLQSGTTPLLHLLSVTAKAWLCVSQTGGDEVAKSAVAAISDVKRSAVDR